MCDYGVNIINKIKVEENHGYAQEYTSGCENILQEKDKEPLTSTLSTSDILTRDPLSTNAPTNFIEEEFILNNVILPFNDGYEEPLLNYVSKDIVEEDPLKIDFPSNQTNVQLELESPSFVTEDSFLSSDVSNKWCHNAREQVETAEYDVSGNKINNTFRLTEQNEGTFYPRLDAVRPIEFVTQSPNVDQAQLPNVDLASPPNTALTFPPKISTADPEYQETRRRLDDMLQRIISKVTKRNSGRRRRTLPAAGVPNAPEEMGPKRRRKSLSKEPEPPSEISAPTQDAIQDPVPISTQSYQSDCSKAQVDSAIQPVKMSTSASALIATLVALLPSTSEVPSDFPPSSEITSMKSSKHRELANKSATPSAMSKICGRRRQPMQQKLVMPRVPSNNAPLHVIQCKGSKTQRQQSGENGIPELAGAKEVAEGEDLRPDKVVFVPSENEVPVESQAPAQGCEYARSPLRSTTSPICSLCGRGFSTWYELKSHVRLHTALRCFFCSRCKQRFAHAQALAAHARRRHNVTLSGDGMQKPFGYMCTLCERTFSWRPSLSNHLQKQHKSTKIVAIASELQNTIRTLCANKKSIPKKPPESSIPKKPPESSTRTKIRHDTPSHLHSSRANSITDLSSDAHLVTCSQISANDFSNAFSVLSVKPNTTLSLCDGETTKQSDNVLSSTKSSSKSPSCFVKKSKTSTNSPLCFVNKSKTSANLPCMQNTPHLQKKSKRSKLSQNSPSCLSDYRDVSLDLPDKQISPQNMQSKSNPSTALFSVKLNSNTPLHLSGTILNFSSNSVFKDITHLSSESEANRTSQLCTPKSKNCSPVSANCTPKVVSDSKNHSSTQRSNSLSGATLDASLFTNEGDKTTPSASSASVSCSSEISVSKSCSKSNRKQAGGKHLNCKVVLPRYEPFISLVNNKASKATLSASSASVSSSSEISVSKSCSKSNRKQAGGLNCKVVLPRYEPFISLVNNKASKATLSASSASVSSSSEISISKSCSKSSRKQAGGKHLNCKEVLPRFEPFTFQSKNFKLQRSFHKLCNTSRQKQNKLPDISPKYNPILPCPITSCTSRNSVHDSEVSNRRLKSLSTFCDDHSSLMSNVTRNSSSCTPNRKCLVPKVVIPRLLLPIVSFPSSTETSMLALNNTFNTKTTAVDSSLPLSLNPVVVLEKIVVPGSNQVE